MIGFFGPNGVGKSTVLDAIGLLFQNFTGTERQRLQTSMLKYVRNIDNCDVSGELSELDGGGEFNSVSEVNHFRIEGQFITEEGETYTVIVGNDPNLFKWKETNSEFVDPTVIGLVNDHPAEVKTSMAHQCYVTSYDKELGKFQLRRDRWPVFKRLFEAVTGFEVDKVEMSIQEETKQSKDSRHLALLDQYVLSLWIKKPHETITDRQCSDGERKIIKNFTTLLNKDRIPSIILIDNVEMHVEIDRHMNLVDCIMECFPDSQIVFTTHSEKIIREYDLDRLISLRNKKISRDETWRQHFSRLLKGFKICFSDDRSTHLCESIESDLNDEKFTDINHLRERLVNLISDGSAILTEELLKWKTE